ncbi:hypothetical protein VTK56DRAFT_6189 [Thermocarpiscus australiensis]
MWCCCNCETGPYNIHMTTQCLCSHSICSHCGLFSLKVSTGGAYGIENLQNQLALPPPQYNGSGQKYTF